MRAGIPTIFAALSLGALLVFGACEAQEDPDEGTSSEAVGGSGDSSEEPFASAYGEGGAFDVRPPDLTDLDASQLPPVPFETSGRFILNADGNRFKPAGVNWYGGESETLAVDGLEYQSLDSIAAQIREMGFNSVRLPWCNELFERNPVIDEGLLTANPDLVGKTVIEVMDAAIDALAEEGLVVILDNHRSRGDWCCDVAHGDGLWYTDEYPQEAWLADWQGMAERYGHHPAVIGADLRNEVRAQLAPDVPDTCTDCDTPSEECVCLWGTWGDTSSPEYRDWAAAAEEAGDLIHEVAPHWLIVVEGTHWASWLGASYRPITLDVPSRVVYSTHVYQMQGGFAEVGGNCDAYKTQLEDAWGHVATSDIGPVWVGEFGWNHDDTDDPWWTCTLSYLEDLDVGWAYWALNGTQGPGYGRTAGAVERYGILNATWDAPANPDHLEQLQGISGANLSP